MATYNGSLFVREQLYSILEQLDVGDEVVVVDDASSDDTPAVVASIGDSRIILIRSAENQGHVRAFEKAVSSATGRYIFLADQDDLWPEGRVPVMLDALGRYAVVVGNFVSFRDDLPPGEVALPLRGQDSGGGLKNLCGVLAGRRSYFGSAMAFRREIVPVFLPIPGYAEAHDLWLAIVGILTGGIGHIEECVLLRRLHGGNLTPAKRRPLAHVLRSRVLMLRAMFEVLRRRSSIGVGRSRAVS